MADIVLHKKELKNKKVKELMGYIENHHLDLVKSNEAMSITD